jgi:ankyrin repeat protein
MSDADSLDALNRLLELSVDINSLETSPLISALEQNKRNTALRLLDLNLDVNVSNAQGQTALMLATRRAIPSCFDLLLKSSIDVNLQDNLGQTALIVAPQLGYTYYVDKLLQHDLLDVNLQDNLGQTALIVAAKQGYADCVEKLLQHDAINFNLQGNDKRTAFDFAFDQNNLSTVRKFSESANFYDNGIVNQEERCLLQLLRQVTHDVNEVEHSTGMTALHKVVNINYSAEIFRSFFKYLLKSSNIDVNALDAKGNTPLLLAINSKKNAYADFYIDLLLKHPGIDINIVNEEGQSAVIKALEIKADKIVQLLLRHEQFNLEDFEKSTGIKALHWALQKEHHPSEETVMALLLKSSCPINDYNEFGLAPLHAGVLYGDINIIKILIDAGADIDQRDSILGRTPLDCTLTNSRSEATQLQILQLLINAGAIDYPHKYGETALQHARHISSQAIVDLLTKARDTQRDRVIKRIYTLDPKKDNDKELCSFIKLLDTVNLANQVNGQDKGDDRLLFHVAALGGVKALDLLLNDSIASHWESAFNLLDDINRYDHEGHTALYHAVRADRVEMVKHILRKNPTLNDKDYDDLFQLNTAEHMVDLLRTHKEQKDRPREGFFLSWFGAGKKAQDPQDPTHHLKK